MYQPQELFVNLSPEEVSRILHLSGIPNQELYTEVDADRFRQCRSLIEEGKSDEEIMGLLPQILAVTEIEPSSSNNTDGTSSKSKKSRFSNEPKDIPKDIVELLSIASKQVGIKISLTQALIVLRICGLQEQDEYSQLECDRFVETYKSIKQSNKSFEEIALELDAKEKSETSGESKLEAVIEVVSEKTVEAQEELSTIVDNITAIQAEQIPALVQSYYLKNVVSKLQQSDSSTNLFSQLESRIIARIEEKKRQRRLSQMTLETTPLQVSSPTPMLSPDASENNMSTE